MRKAIFLIILPLIIGCAYYTPREQAAINGMRQGDRTILSSMNNEELIILRRKIIEEQAWCNAFISSSSAVNQSTMNSLNSFQRTLEIQEQQRQLLNYQRQQNQFLDYQKQQADALQRQAEALEIQNRYLIYGY